MKAEGTRDTEGTLNAPDIQYGSKALKQNGAKVKPIVPKLAAWMETAIPESLTVMYHTDYTSALGHPKILSGSTRKSGATSK